MPRSGWDMLTLALWSLFFAVGLVPEPVFHTLRDLAQVATYRAFVNSSAIITLGLSVYLALFVLRRCLDAGASRIDAQNRAIQTAVLGLIAFLEVPTRGGVFEVRTLLEMVYRAREIPDDYLRTVVLGVGVAKLGVWLYLYTLVIRYHAFGQRDVFCRAWTLFPAPPADKSDAESDEKGSKTTEYADQPGEIGPEEWDEFSQR